MSSEISPGLTPIAERQIEVLGHLRLLITCYQGCQGDDAAVALRQLRALPEIAHQGVARVVFQCRRHGSHLLRCGRAWRGEPDRGGGLYRTGEVVARARHTGSSAIADDLDAIGHSAARAEHREQQSGLDGAFYGHRCSHRQAVGVAESGHLSGVGKACLRQRQAAYALPGECRDGIRHGWRDAR